MRNQDTVLSEPGSAVSLLQWHKSGHFNPDKPANEPGKDWLAQTRHPSCQASSSAHADWTALPGPLAAQAALYALS